LMAGRLKVSAPAFDYRLVARFSSSASRCSISFPFSVSVFMAGLLFEGYNLPREIPMRRE
jgi:hypothetical protein